ncbi:MAG TPA: hypothetical protein VJT32_08060 [bacterium]|nr:hypothetical protein [bacterium]
MTIQRNKSSNRFCGPAALAAITGIHVDDAAYTLRKVSGKRFIKGIGTRHMLAAIERLGHRAQPMKLGLTYGYPTLTQALAGVLKGRPSDARYLVLITGHYVTIQGRRLVDNKHPEGIALTACPYRRKRVKGVWQIEAAAPVKPVREMSRARFVEALAKLNLEVADSQYVDAPAGFRFQGGTHTLAITGTYEEALVRVASELPLLACPQDCDCQG